MTATIYLSDCRAAIRQMAAGSVHCVVTSPPYYNLRDYAVEGQLGMERIPDCLGWATGEQCGACYICHLVEVFREVRRVLRDDGTVWLNLGDSYAGGGNGGGGSCATCGAPYQRVTGEPVPANGRGSGNVERKVATEGERARVNTHLGSSVPWTPTAVPTVGWEPTCKHEAGPTVAAVVLDVFGGSGTTALVAERLGRHAVLCELNPEYVALAARRIREAAPLLARVEIVTVKE